MSIKLLQFLSNLNRERIHHLDIKPENLLLEGPPDPPQSRRKKEGGTVSPSEEDHARRRQARQSAAGNSGSGNSRLNTDAFLAFIDFGVTIQLFGN